MHLATLILHVAVLAGFTDAFYPYKHTKSIQKGESTNKKDGIHTRVTESLEKGSLKLSIKRKAISPNVGSHQPRIIHSRSRGRKVENQAASPVKRENAFKIVTAATPSQTNSLPIDQDGTDYSYFASIPFGSKGTILYMLVDTGAANTWIMGSDCTTQTCQKHTTFGEADSSTYKSTSDSFKLSYGTGSVSGVTANDTVQIAGMSVPLSFGAANTTSDDFLDYPMDGILGLGRSASNTMKSPTAMEAIMSTKNLKGNLFGVNLQRESDGSTDGELSFGAPDTTKYTGDLSYSDTVSDGKMWEIPVDDVGFDGQLCKFTGKTAVIDTGTTFMLLPPDDSKKLHALIPGSKQDGDLFDVPCSTKQPVEIVISGITYNISSKDYIGSPVKGGNLCESNIVGKQAFTANTWLLGDVFLKNVYSVFDLDEEQIGFGIKAADTASSLSSTGSGTAKATASGSMTAFGTSASSTSTSFKGSAPNSASSMPSPTAASGAADLTSTPSVIGLVCTLFLSLLISS